MVKRHNIGFLIVVLRPPKSRGYRRNKTTEGLDVRVERGDITLINGKQEKADDVDTSSSSSNSSSSFRGITDCGCCLERLAESLEFLCRAIDEHPLDVYLRDRLADRKYLEDSKFSFYLKLYLIQESLGKLSRERLSIVPPSQFHHDFNQFESLALRSGYKDATSLVSASQQQQQQQHPLRQRVYVMRWPGRHVVAERFCELLDRVVLGFVAKCVSKREEELEFLRHVKRYYNYRDGSSGSSSEPLLRVWKRWYQEFLEKTRHRTVFLEQCINGETRAYNTNAGSTIVLVWRQVADPLNSEPLNLESQTLLLLHELAHTLAPELTRDTLVDGVRVPAQDAHGPRFRCAMLYLFQCAKRCGYTDIQCDTFEQCETLLRRGHQDSSFGYPWDARRNTCF